MAVSELVQHIVEKLIERASAFLGEELVTSTADSGKRLRPAALEGLRQDLTRHVGALDPEEQRLLAAKHRIDLTKLDAKKPGLTH